MVVDLKSKFWIAPAGREGNTYRWTSQTIVPWRRTLESVLTIRDLQIQSPTSSNTTFFSALTSPSDSTTASQNAPEIIAWILPTSERYILNGAKCIAASGLARDACNMHSRRGVLTISTTIFLEKGTVAGFTWFQYTLEDPGSTNIWDFLDKTNTTSTKPTSSKSKGVWLFHNKLSLIPSCPILNQLLDA